jgi:hypothetical protein
VKRSLLGLLGWALAIVAGMAGPSRADFAQFDLGVLINGTAPSGTSPYLTAAFSSVSAGTVTLTLTNNTAASPEQFVDTWLFALDPTLDSNTVTFTYEAGQSTGPAATVSKGVDQFGNNSGVTGYGNNSSGLFDFKLAFPKAGNVNRFGGQETVVYTLTGSGITASSFKFTGAPNYNANGPYYSAAHVQGIPMISGTTSGAIGANAVVPEPSSIALVGVGLSVIAGALCRARLRSGTTGTC